MKNLSNELVEKFQTRDSFEIAKGLGILVIGEPLGKIDGYYNKIEGQKIIHVNTDLPLWLQKFAVGCQLYYVIKDIELQFELRLKYELNEDAIRFATFLYTDFAALEEFGFERLAVEHGIEKDIIPFLKTRFNKIIGGAINGKSSNKRQE